MADNENAFGRVQIADEVIAIIAGTAALEIDGVDAVAGNVADTVVEFFGRKSQSRGVKIGIENGEVSVEIDIAVKYGTKVQDIAVEVQGRVKNAVETMTGLKVVLVNVNITGLTTEKPKAASADAEE